jgi:hypothetical protein
MRKGKIGNNQQPTTNNQQTFSQGNYYDTRTSRTKI